MSASSDSGAALPFAERYAPKTLADVVFTNPDVKARLALYASGRMQGSILLHGPFGTGKSATALAIVHQRRTSAGCDGPYVYRYSGADLDSEGKTLLNSLGMACVTDAGWSPYLIVDEIDQLSKRGQAHLAHLLDTVQQLRLIMTTNNIAAVDGKLQSRSDCIFVAPATPNDWLPRVQGILRNEGVHISDASALALVGQAQDARRIMRALEAFIAHHGDASGLPALPGQPAMPIVGPPSLTVVPGNTMVSAHSMNLPMTTSFRVLGALPSATGPADRTP